MGLKASQISILGCGWVGLPLAEYLISVGYIIKGSTTSEYKLQRLESSKISPYLIHLDEEQIVGDISEFLATSETLIINIPPGLRRNPQKNHVKAIENLVSEIEKSSVKNVLYISSTSVFQDEIDFPKIADDTLPNATSRSSKQLIDIEVMLQNNPNFKTTILRFSGLFGDDRHPGKFLSGKKELKNPEAPVNLIHQTDCIAIIAKLIHNSIWDVTLNACYPAHPARKAYYTNYCKAHDLALPGFDNSFPSKGKIIDGSKVAQLLSYKYQTGL